MIRSDVVRHGLLPGAPAGAVGGIVFGAAMTQLGVLPTIAALVGATSAVSGFVVHMAIAIVIGAGFGVLVWQQRPGAGETLFWGLAFGAFWWFVGPITLLPLFLGEPLAWSLAGAQEQFPSLLGHLLYGVSTALALVLISRRDFARSGMRQVARGALIRGGLAGLGAAWLLGGALSAQNLTVSTAMAHESRPVNWLAALAIGLVGGLGYALLYPRSTDGAGPAIVRGVAYGFLWWVVAALTLLPLIEGDGLTWSLVEARANFATLPGYLLFGAALARLYHFLDALVRVLFSDDIRARDREGAGAEGVRAIGRGALAGLVGGLLFTLVMLQIGFLPTVARLVGSDSAVSGLVIHLLIADLIGASYGLLFRGQTYDVRSALGWGLSYGVLWWVLGPLTLLPVLLGGSPQWSVAGASAAFPALIGHLAFGAGLGVTFYLLEARYCPWWITRTQTEATRAARRKEQVLTSAPALWALTVVIALILPILLSK